jgi:hypothetical protein
MSSADARYRALRRLVMIVAVAMTVATCVGIVGHASEVTCEDVPDAACQEQVDALVAAANGPVSTIAVSCAVLGCTRAGGSGVASITLADGTAYQRSWSYTGDPNPPPDPVCVGVPREICIDTMRDVIGHVSPSRHIQSATVTCLRQTCDRQGGDVRVVFTSAGGLEDSSETEWDGQPASP